LAVHSEDLSPWPVFFAHEQRQVRIKGAAPDDSVWVLDNGEMAEMSREAKPAEPLPRLLIILDLPSATYLEPEGRLYEEKTTDTDGMKSIRLVSYIRVPASDWIHAARSPRGLGKESLNRAFGASISRKRERPVRMTRLSETSTQEGKHAIEHRS
jgi:hypothetical protein